MKSKITLFLPVLIFLFSTAWSQTKLITSFEKDYNLADITLSQNAKIEQTKEFAALGRYALNVKFPSNGGELTINNLPVKNWETYNPNDVFLLFVRAANQGHAGFSFTDSGGKRYSERILLKQGSNHIQISLNQLKDAGLNIRDMKSVFINSDQSNSLYLDYMCLDNYQPALADLGRYDIKYSDEVRTKHFPWANPLFGGAIKTYTVAPVGDGRGIIELSQRMEMNNTITSLGRTPGLNRWGFGAFYDRRNLQNLEYGNPYGLIFNYIADDLLYGPNYDVIIWPGLHSWNEYPKIIRDNILERVNNGAGLILLDPLDSMKSEKPLWDISPIKPEKNFGIKFVDGPRVGSIVDYADSSVWRLTDNHFITRGIPLGAFPKNSMGVLPYENNGGEVLIQTENGHPVLTTGQYGKGRIVAISYQEYGMIPQVRDPWETGLHFDYWEYMWSLLGRSVLWAVHRDDAPVQILNAEWENDKLNIKFDGSLSDASLRLYLEDDFGQVEMDQTFSLNPQEKSKTIEIDPQNLHGGGHIATLQLKIQDAVSDWYSIRFKTDQVVRIGSISLDKETVSIGDTVTGEVILEKSKKWSGLLSAKLIDNYGRLISEGKYKVGSKDNKLSFALPANGVKSHLSNIDVVLLEENGKQIDHQKKEVFVLLKEPWNDFKITMYGFNPPPIPGTWNAVDSQMRRINVTTLAAYPLSTSKHSNYSSMASVRIPGVESTPHFEKVKNEYIETGDKMKLIRKPDLMDHDYRNEVHKVLRDGIELWKKFSPDAYYIFEEASATDHGGVLDLSFSELSLNAMRNWLKIEYGTLESLNHQWGTDFKIWEQVIPDDYKEAQARGNYSSWADHATFTEKTWIDLLKFVQQTTYRYDKDGLVQLSGTQESVPFNGYDYPLLDKYVDQMNTYNLGNQLHFHRNFNPSLKLSGQAGYGQLGKAVLHDYYDHIFLGETDGAYIFWQYSALQPDLTLSPSAELMKKGFDEVKRGGIAKLIGSFRPENENGIAIHYSMPSIHGAWIADGVIKKGNPWDNFSDTWSQYDRNRDGWVKVLMDAGVGFDFISYLSIEDGDLIAKGYKTLILPMSMALSDREIRQIRLFVDHGGIVIADALPGIMDNHTKFRDKRALGDVFGIADRTYSGTEIVTPAHETDLKLNGARRLNFDGKEIIFNQYGSGKAYLLNYFLDKYSQQKLDKENQPELEKINALLAHAGIQSSIKVSKADGSAVLGIAKFVFEKAGSGTKLLGLLPEKNIDKGHILIHLDEPRYIYDIRNSRYLGKDTVIQVEVESEVPVLFGLTEGRITSIQVDNSTVAHLGETIDMRLTVKGENLNKITTVIRTEVIDPLGQSVEIYGENIGISNGGEGLFRFRTALNDPTGQWKIVFTDVISHTQKIVLINVNE